MIKIASLTVIIFFLVSNGPYTEFYFKSFINSDAINFYQSVYKDEIVILPKSFDVLKQAFWSSLSVVALLTSVLCVKQTRAKSLFVYIWLSLSLLLETMDIIHYKKINDIQNIVTGFFANFIGSFIAAGICIGIAAFSDSITKNTTKSRYGLLFLPSAISVSMSFLAFLLTFYSFDYFLRPIAVTIELVSDISTSGMIAVEAGNHSDENRNVSEAHIKQKHNDLEDFSLVPDIETKEISINAISPGGFQTIKWEDKIRGDGYDLYIDIYSECLVIDAKKTNISRNALKFENIENFESSFTSGGFVLDVRGIRNSSGIFHYQPSDFTLYNTEKSTEDEKFAFSSFSKGHIFSYEADGSIRIVNSTMMFDTDADGSKNVNRRLAFKINNKFFSIDFIPKTRKSLNQSQENNFCKSVNIKKDREDNQKMTANINGDSIAILITISPRKDRIQGMYDKSRSEFQTGSGWLTMNGLKSEDLKQVAKKKLKMISMKNLKQVVINKSKSDVNEGDEYYIFGDLTGYFLDGNSIKIDGKADLLWKNNKRASPTKWESIGVDVMTPLLAVLAAEFLFVLRYVSRILSNDTDIEWLK